MKKPSIAFVAGLALTVALSGCATGSVAGGAAQTDNSGTQKVKVGLFPSSAVGAFQLGVDKGFFTKHGIDLQLVLGQSSAAQLPAVNTGSLDFLLASPTTPLLAVSKGLDLKVVSGYGVNRPDRVTDSVAVLVGKGSSIHSAKDLQGKTVSINALGSIGEIGIKEAVRLDGGDPNKVTFVQLGFDQVGAQLESGRIDAGMAGPPFMQQIEASGGKVVSDFIQEAKLGGAELVMVSGGKLIEKDPKLVQNFVAALTETLDYAEAHQDEVRGELPKVLKTDPKVAARTDLIKYDARLNVPALQQFSDLMLRYGVMSTKPDLSKVVWTK